MSQTVKKHILVTLDKAEHEIPLGTRSTSARKDIIVKENLADYPNNVLAMIFYYGLQKKVRDCVAGCSDPEAARAKSSTRQRAWRKGVVDARTGDISRRAAKRWASTNNRKQAEFFKLNQRIQAKWIKFQSEYEEDLKRIADLIDWDSDPATDTADAQPGAPDYIRIKGRNGDLPGKNELLVEPGETLKVERLGADGATAEIRIAFGPDNSLIFETPSGGDFGGQS